MDKIKTVRQAEKALRLARDLAVTGSDRIDHLADVLSFLVDRLAKEEAEAVDPRERRTKAVDAWKRYTRVGW
jgi:hypothetical protein